MLLKWKQKHLQPLLIGDTLLHKQIASSRYQNPPTKSNNRKGFCLLVIGPVRDPDSHDYLKGTFSITSKTQ